MRLPRRSEANPNSAFSVSLLASDPATPPAGCSLFFAACCLLCAGCSMFCTLSSLLSPPHQTRRIIYICTYHFRYSSSDTFFAVLFDLHTSYLLSKFSQRLRLPTSEEFSTHHASR